MVHVIQMFCLTSPYCFNYCKQPGQVTSFREELQSNCAFCKDFVTFNHKSNLVWQTKKNLNKLREPSFLEIKCFCLAYFLPLIFCIPFQLICSIGRTSTIVGRLYERVKMSVFLVPYLVFTSLACSCMK